MKCAKVKNPCKICLQTVTNKTGLQCKGACKKWAHYTCLNYTPGKIKDIKAGIIKITCPCPNCNTSSPKEQLTNPPFTCTSHECLANQPSPICSADDFPKKQVISLSKKPPPRGSPAPNTYKLSPRPPQPPSEPSPSPPLLSLPPPCEAPPPPPCETPPPKIYKPPSSQSKDWKSPPCSNETCFSSQLSKASSCSCLMCCKGDDTQKSQLLRTTSSDSEMFSPKEKQRVLLSAIEHLCGTVGQLSTQIKELMSKMLANIDNC